MHVALHGCQQTHATIGDKFIKNTGCTRWADTNSIVVLFPQTRVDSTSPSTAASGSLAKPNRCWDWIGWYGGNFARRAGAQVAAIKAMVDQLSSDLGGGGGALPAPATLATQAPRSAVLGLSQAWLVALLTRRAEHHWRRNARAEGRIAGPGRKLRPSPGNA